MVWKGTIEHCKRNMSRRGIAHQSRACPMGGARSLQAQVSHGWTHVAMTVVEAVARHEEANSARIRLNWPWYSNRPRCRAGERVTGSEPGMLLATNRPASGTVVLSRSPMITSV